MPISPTAGAGAAAPRPQALSRAQGGGAPAGAASKQPVASSYGDYYAPSYPPQPYYPYPPQPRWSLWHGLGNVVSGLGEMAGAVLSGAWALTKGVLAVGAAVVVGAFCLVGEVAKALWRGVRAVFDPSYDHRYQQPPYDPYRPY